MDTIKIKDFLSYSFLSNVKCSPDGTRIVFQKSECVEEEDTYHHNLYMVKEGGCTPLTSSHTEGDFIFLDNDTILCKSGRSPQDRECIKEGKERSSYYAMPLTGGEARLCFTLPLTVQKLQRVRDGLYVVLALFDTQESVWGREDEEDTILAEKKEAKRYEVFTKIPFYANGGGFSKEKIGRLFLYDAVLDRLSAITDTSQDVGDFDIDEQGTSILYVAQKSALKPRLKAGIFEYTLASKECQTRLVEEKYNISSAHYVDDSIVFFGRCEYAHGLNDNDLFYTLDSQNKVTLLHANEDSLWGSVGSDCRYGGGVSRMAANHRLYYISTLEKDSLVMSVGLDGCVQTQVHINGSVDCFYVHNDTVFFVGMKDGALQEVYAQTRDEIRPLCQLNNALDNKYVAPYERVPFTNNGMNFRGWVLLPKDFDPHKKYPAILDIHGGPKTVYGEVFYHEMQVWANKGYIVFFTNPRGSDGFGNAFADIYGRYGSIDYADLMAFTDEVIHRYPSIDTTRMGVTGGSYGGFMSNWIISHTDRFACAATQRSISNWVSFYGTSDIGMFFTEDQVRGNIYNRVEALWDQSPLRYAANINTPTLFIHSDEDYRCPLEQGLQLYTSMVDRGVEARFVLFHGENHELSRSGSPKNRVKRLEEITNWMEIHLK